MKKLIYILLLLLSFHALASGDGIDLDDADISLSNKISLERGAKYFVTYCLGCHSAKYIRYKRIALDLNIAESEILKSVAPLGAGIYDPMHSAMNEHDAQKWFGTLPPDLSLIARVRGADWLYTYLRSFYTDPNRPWGVNNAVFKDVAMPNVFWQLQGKQMPIIKKAHGQETITGLKLEQAGQMTPEEFDLMVNDLVSFLVYIGEPTQAERKDLGKYVLLFLLIFTILAYLLKKEYWKDVH